MTERKSKGFSRATIVLTLVIVGLLGVTAWHLWHNRKPVKSQTSYTSNNHVAWETYTDTNYAAASGISIKYPADWTIKSATNSSAWQIVHDTVPASAISTRTIFLNNSISPKQEWEQCTEPAACGPGVNDQILASQELTINGLAAYDATLASPAGKYYVTVLKSNKPSSDGTAFVEFIIHNPDSKTLLTYNQIVRSAKF